MQVDLIQPEDMPEILAWWTARGEGEMPIEILPPRGFVARKDGQAMAGAWVYEPNGCRIVFLDWLIARPGLAMADARDACQSLFKFIETDARAHGIARIFASVSNPIMIREANRVGFTVCASQMTHLCKSL